MSESALSLLKGIKKNRELLENLNKTKDNILNDIKIMERKLWDTCDHEWVRDYNAPFDDLCPWFCKHCTLCRDRRHYNN